MKILVDAMCAEFGGIRTYAEHLLGHWAEVHPDDELHVLVPTGSTLPTTGHVRHELAVPRPAVLGRPLAQTRALTRLAREVGPDAVLVTVPSTTLRAVAAPMAVVICDLRHELRPEQFSRSRRVLRRVSYGRTYALADAFLAISQRSLDDLHRLHPATRTMPSRVTHLGGDHVHAWPKGDRSGPALGFAHHTNKNPELLLEAWRLLAAEPAGAPRLLLVGLGAAQRAAIAARLVELGLTACVELAPFLPEAEFRAVVAAADLIVFPSDFEGFGLPVVEGMLLGKPVVIGPEPGTEEVAGGHASVATDWTPAALAEAVRRAQAMSPADLGAARQWAGGFRWARTVQQTREALVALRSPQPGRTGS